MALLLFLLVHLYTLSISHIPITSHNNGHCLHFNVLTPEGEDYPKNYLLFQDPFDPSDLPSYVRGQGCNKLHMLVKHPRNNPDPQHKMEGQKDRRDPTKYIKGSAECPPFTYCSQLSRFRSWGILPPPTQNGRYIEKYPEINHLESVSMAGPLFRFAFITYGGEVNWRTTAVPEQPSLSVAVTHLVSKEAHQKAALTVSKMVQFMPREIFNSIAKSKGVGIFSKKEGPTVYPEFKRFADKPGCKDKCDGQCQITCTLDGRKYEQVAGLTLSRSVCLDHVVLCDDQDPYRSHENCLCHELGHLIMSFMPKYWKNKTNDAYQNAKEKKLWNLKAYAMSNAQEYWAEGTGAFFRSNLLTYAAGKMNMCNNTEICASEKEARYHLQKQDPQLFELLSYIYTDNRPHLSSGMRTCM